MKYTQIKSPVGTITLVTNDKALVAIHFEKNGRRVERDWEKADRHPILEKAKRQLTEFFSGKRTQFDLPCEFSGTAFQKKVWKTLGSIPYGETRSYADIARKVGSPKAFRAVGAANGRNPIPIIYPCHRVIGANGTLTGFGGGLKAKDILLKLESQHR